MADDNQQHRLLQSLRDVATDASQLDHILSNLVDFMSQEAGKETLISTVQQWRRGEEVLASSSTSGSGSGSGNNMEQDREAVDQAAATLATAATNRSSKMKIIPPSEASDSDKRVLNLLQRLDRLLFEQSTLDKFNDECDDDDSGVRNIQGRRFEVFCRAHEKSSAAFDWLCKQLLKQQQRSRKQNTNRGQRGQRGRRAADGDENSNNGSEASPFRTFRDIKNAILDYAVEQARRDPRIGGGYKFDNFSLIVNYGKVKAQPIHIDLLAPNHQFGLVLTNNSPPTLEYQAEYSIASVANLKRAWSGMPDSLKRALSSDRTTAPQLLRNFGDVLCPIIRRVPPEIQEGESNNPNSSTTSTTSSTLCRTGTLLSTDGSTMHAGPECGGNRAVMFFSGNPIGGADTVNGDDAVHNGASGAAAGVDAMATAPAATLASTMGESRDVSVAVTATAATVKPYDPDDQYWKSFLIYELTLSVWETLSNDDGDDDDNDAAGRIYLLTKLAEAIESRDSEHLHTHLLHPTLSKFAKIIEKRLFQGMTRDEFIATFVADYGSLLCVPAVLMSEFSHEYRNQYVEKVSADELTVKGESTFVQVYRIMDYEDGTDTETASDSDTFPVCLYYPADATMEGTIESEPYTLTMASNTSALFDGTNGVLCAAGKRGKVGEVITCHVDGGKRKATTTLSDNESTMAANKKKRARE